MNSSVLFLFCNPLRRTLFLQPWICLEPPALLFLFRLRRPSQDAMTFRHPIPHCDSGSFKRSINRECDTSILRLHIASLNHVFSLSLFFFVPVVCFQPPHFKTSLSTSSGFLPTSSSQEMSFSTDSPVLSPDLPLFSREPIFGVTTKPVFVHPSTHLVWVEASQPPPLSFLPDFFHSGSYKKQPGVGTSTPPPSVMRDLGPFSLSRWGFFNYIPPRLLPPFS